MRTTFILTIASTLLSLAIATPAGTLSTPNTNALLPLGARSAQKGCWEQCSNHLQCQGLCYRCSDNGRVSPPPPPLPLSFLDLFLILPPGVENKLTCFDRTVPPSRQAR
ncbi:hypothetical protein DL98DRAFT_282827 [Cadophora sp. DSE1049]|nr:hypothetical protein DL98DRAFT_282827 [Cadophora sp. DSE1049]